MLHRKQWIPLATAILIVQAAMEGHAVFRMIRLGMLPTGWLMVVIAAAAGLVVLTACLMFGGMKKGPGKGRRIRRVIAVVLAVVMMIGSILVSAMAMQVDDTVRTVTKKDRSVSAMVGVYVKADDPAKTIQDAAGYTFAIMREFDRANTDQAISSLGGVLGSDPDTSGFESAADCAAALYDNTVNAILINESYAGTLADLDEYQSFDTDTRLLYEIPVRTGTDSDGNGAAGSSDGVPSDSFAAQEVSDVTSQPFLVYISGSDTRDEVLTTSRSDVNILMAVNPKTRQILLLNTPRDYYVPNPAGGGAEDKLTHCGLYGIECSSGALEQLYSTHVSYYVQLNFTGFQSLIDGIGGITVNAPQDFTAGGYSFTAGQNEVNGEQALAFARERHAFASGDNQRGQDQMEVIRAVIEKVTSGTTVLKHYSEILNSLQNMMVTSIRADEIEALVKMQLSDPSRWDVRRYAVTGTGGKSTTYSMPNQKAYVMYPDQASVDQASQLLAKILSGEQLTDADVSA
jgi:LCP family protein required for cell wall assembly